MNKKKGFTLVEILAVVIILGIISVIVYPVLNKMLKDNRKRAFEASLSSVVRAAELYKTDNNNTLGIIDYDDNVIDMSNLGKWKAGTLTDKVDTDGSTKIYLTGFYDGEFCATGFENNFTIVEGNCVETPELCFMVEDNTVVEYGFNYSVCPSSVSIPTKIGDEDIFYIGEGAFADSSVSSVVIPNSIKEIRDGAFYDSYLESLDLSNATALQYIGDSAFEDTYLDEVDFSNLNSLTEIAEDAFESSNLLGIVDLSNSLNLFAIGAGSFIDNQISAVRLNNLTSLEFIGSHAFGYNNISGELDLSNLTSLQYIGEASFSDNDISSLNLANLTSLGEIDDYAFQDNSIEGTLSIKNLPNLRYINEEAFSGNSISNLDFSGTNLLEGFDYCSFCDNAIETLVYDSENNIQWIGSWAFVGNQLQSLDLSSFTHLSYIGADAFNDNQLPDSQAFIYYLDGTLDTSILTSYGGAKRDNIVIPSNVIKIGTESFGGMEITSVDFTQATNLQYIDSHAFRWNNLTSISLPSTVKEIGQYAFDSNRITQGNAIINNFPGNITIYSYAFSNNGDDGNTEITPKYVYEDSIAPVLTMLGSSPVTVEVGASYTDPGATAIDNIEGDITDTITTTSTVNTSSIGTYTITYTVSDSMGNISTAVRTVNVVDTTPPVITLNGSNPMSIGLNSTYTDPGATVTDNLDQSLVATATGTVDTSVIGTYTVTYIATDSNGNAATPVIRTIYVTNGIYYTAANKLPVYGIAGATYPPTSWTGIQNASVDDGYSSVPLPFSVKMFGNSYSTVYICSNSYITFGGGTSAYSSLSATNPAYNKLFFGASDNSYQRVSYYSTTKYVRIRYEGTSSTSGTVGSPSIVVELTIFNPTYTKDNVTIIEMLVGNHGRTSGVSNISNATGTTSVSYTIAPSTSYVFLGDSNGNNFQVFSGAQATNVDY